MLRAVLITVAGGQTVPADVLAAAHRAMGLQRAVKEDAPGRVVGGDFYSLSTDGTGDGHERIPMREVTAKDAARANRAEANAAKEAEKQLKYDDEGFPARGETSKDYSKRAGKPASVGKMLDEAVVWSMKVRGTHDPVYTRDVLGMKGVKFFTEWLDLMRLAVVRGDDPSHARSVVQDVVPAVLAQPEYHAWIDFHTDSWRFRQDSMSYMRAYYLCAMTELDLAQSHPDVTRDWRRRIVAALPRIWEHLETRGIDQKLNFLKLFRALELYDVGPAIASADTPLLGAATKDLLPTTTDLNSFELAVFKTTLLWRQVPVGWYMLSPERPYDISHEIFALTDDGRYPFPFKPDQDLIEAGPSFALVEETGDDTVRFYRYALDTVTKLLRVYMHRDQLDIVCEFVVNLGQLGIRIPRSRRKRSDIHVLYRTAIDYVRSRRNHDGSFGEMHDVDMIRLRKKNAIYDPDVGGTLHTTYVCLWALTQPIYDDDDATSWAALLPPNPNTLLTGAAEDADPPTSLDTDGELTTPDDDAARPPQSTEL